jgi:hypothetical protein
MENKVNWASAKTQWVHRHIITKGKINASKELEEDRANPSLKKSSVSWVLHFTDNLKRRHVINVNGYNDKAWLLGADHKCFQRPLAHKLNTNKTCTCVVLSTTRRGTRKILQCCVCTRTKPSIFVFVTVPACTYFIIIITILYIIQYSSARKTNY